MKAIGQRAGTWWLIALAAAPGLVPGEPVSAAPVAAQESGPVLPLDYTGTSTNDFRIADFMYFVALISPQPVSVSESPTNTLRVRMNSLRQDVWADRFSLGFAFDVTGAGFRHYAIDQSRVLQRHARQLKSGKALERQLDYIRFEGAGKGRLDVQGRIEGGRRTVNLVRVRFDDRGGISPVTIGLKDIKSIGGSYRFENELVARVKALEFNRGGKPPRMAVLLDSVRRKGAGDNLFQNLKGQIIGAVANLLLDPIVVDELGNNTMLDFGRALLNREPSFAFPAARNLKQE